MTTTEDVCRVLIGVFTFKNINIYTDIYILAEQPCPNIGFHNFSSCSFSEDSLNLVTSARRSDVELVISNHIPKHEILQ